MKANELIKDAELLIESREKERAIHILSQLIMGMRRMENEVSKERKILEEAKELSPRELIAKWGSNFPWQSGS
jgi:hypothetical protein